mgnify:CR=1 FL=1
MTELLPDRMSGDQVSAENKVRANQAPIPARIRRELGIEDGDRLQWRVQDDGSIRVQVVNQQVGTFADFDGYDGKKPTAVTTDQDAWGLGSE